MPPGSVEKSTTDYARNNTAACPATIVAETSMYTDYAVRYTYTYAICRIPCRGKVRNPHLFCFMISINITSLQEWSRILLRKYVTCFMHTLTQIGGGCGCDRGLGQVGI